MKFLEDVVKKTIKKLVLKVARKGKASSEEVLEDTGVGGGLTFGDGSSTSGGNILIAWIRKPMETT